MTTSQERRQLIRGCVILLSLIVCAFLWLSILSFDPTDWPSPHNWPHPAPANNDGGRAGAWIAYHMFIYFGGGAYAAVAGLTAAIGVLARVGRLPSLWQRVIGVAVLISVTSVCFHLLTPSVAEVHNLPWPFSWAFRSDLAWPFSSLCSLFFEASEAPRWPELRGGVLGYVLATWLVSSFKIGTLPVLAYLCLVGLLFTTEGLILRIPQAIRERRGQIQELAEEVRQRLPKTSWTARLAAPFQRLATILPGRRQPALAGGTAGAGRASGSAELRINPGRNTGNKADVKTTESKTTPKRAAVKETGTAVLDPDEHQKPSLDAAADTEEEETIDETAEGECENDTEDSAQIEEQDAEEEDEETDVEDTDNTETGESDEESEDQTPDTGPGPRMIIRASQPPKPGAAAPPPVPKPYPTELAEWTYPPITVLQEPEYTFTSHQEALVREKARILEQTLLDYKIEAKVVEIDTGPVITMFEISVAPGVKVSQISSLANDIARSLKAPSVRVVAPIPGKNTIGIEVPNLDKEKVRIKELMTLAGAAAQKMQLPLFLGKDASGGALVSDLTKMPHMLIAGTTGSGKSVCINSIIISILMTQRPDLVKLILVDPKMVEMSMFREVPHLMCPIVTEMERAEKILEWATVKMDERYALLAEAGVRNIAAYNRLNKEEKRERFQPSTPEEEIQIPSHLPYIVIIIDELADMMMLSAKEVEHHLSRLAQKSRAVGIHIIVATQRPEAKIVTGLIKSNLPCRIAFRVASRMDSRIVLDQNGAEVLMGQGDMLYLPPGSSKLMRAQGTYLEDAELKSVINFLKERGAPEFHPELIQLRNQEISTDGPRDELFDKAVEIVLETKRGSVSLLQRRLAVGYSRASRLIEEMAAAGIVGEYKGSQAREIVITPEQWQTMKEAEAERLRSTALKDDGVPDMLYDDDL
ncbi:MAG TPA: DNA translocase FtsK 4TM domain-containing protein [Phycisphaerae bacterium]|nr:DNA translocase FtsK 4TM domain-containing protein [Phycisphaerae bacterium]HRY66394.1 DNA translocase FtsK 4TM domain-containing protein [Phycisphaerae bacterium]HSA25899.1 DNA translocase FtsK 4TM domain-containing protein [Phycisphaerae bacterium]